MYTTIMSRADDFEKDLREVLSQFSNSEKSLHEASKQEKAVYSITVDTYENLPFPILRHVFYGRTIEEAEGFIEAHKKADDFFRQCAKGNWKDTKCRHARPVVRKVQLAEIKAEGGRKPGGLKNSPVSKIPKRSR